MEAGFELNSMGFAITFENGYRISVIFTRGAYCHNYNDPKTSIWGGYRNVTVMQKARDIDPSNCPDEITCPDAEIAVIRSLDDEFVTDTVCEALDIDCYEDGSVVGYMTPNDFARICDYVSKMEEVKE